MTTKKIKSAGYMFESMTEERNFLLHNRDRYKHTLALLEKSFQNSQGLALLDIGASPFTFLLQKKYEKSDLWTLDYDKHLRERSQNAGIKFVWGDLSLSTTKLPKKKFDIITYLEVIEHLKQGYVESLENLASLLKPNGICVVQTPNNNSLKNILLKKLGLQKFWDRNSVKTIIPDHFVHHREFSRKELENMIRSIKGITILSSNYGLYYDTVSSSTVYRKRFFLMREFLWLHYMLVRCIPFLRADIEIVFSKNASS